MLDMMGFDDVQCSKNPEKVSQIGRHLSPFFVSDLAKNEAGGTACYSRTWSLAESHPLAQRLSRKIPKE